MFVGVAGQLSTVRCNDVHCTSGFVVSNDDRFPSTYVPCTCTDIRISFQPNKLRVSVVLNGLSNGLWVCTEIIGR